MSPSNFIIEIRLERASRLLQEQAGSTSEVCYAVGFKSLSHFSKRFRDKYHVTPTRYRERAASSVS